VKVCSYHAVYTTCMVQEVPPSTDSQLPHMYQTIYKGTVSTYVQLILLEDHEGNKSKLIMYYVYYNICLVLR
jgi:hypothetical protein